jgi:hypothetical protein
MELLWSTAGATRGKQLQIGRPPKPRKQAKSVAVGCDWWPRASNGKEGVDGSSPSEGLKSLHTHSFCRLCSMPRWESLTAAHEGLGGIVWRASRGVTTMRSTERPEAPDDPQELFLLEDSFGILGERDEKLVLLRRELHRLAGQSGDSGGGVDLEVAHGQARCRGPFERRRTARIRASGSS